MVTLTVTDEITEYLNEMLDKEQDLRDPLQEIGELAVDFVHETIDTEGRGLWDPPKIPTGHPLLFDTGTLYESISYNVSDHSVDVGSPLEYATYQDSMRPFMFVDDPATEEIESIITKHFDLE